MILWVLERCRKVGGVTDVLVATDDDRIAEVVTKAGGTPVMTPSDLPSGTERVHAASRESDADIIVNVQGDEPLIPPATIEAVIAILQNRSFDIGTAAVPFKTSEDIANPNSVKVVTGMTGEALYFSRSIIPYQRDTGLSGEHAYLRHVGIYAYRKAALERFISLPPSPLERIEQLEQLRALQNGMKLGVATVEAATPSVDVPDDIGRVEAFLRSGG